MPFHSQKPIEGCSEGFGSSVARVVRGFVAVAMSVIFAHFRLDIDNFFTIVHTATLSSYLTLITDVTVHIAMLLCYGNAWQHNLQNFQC
ncbi:hypothetical protein GQ44DRAFT_425881 [Phaeosphaeriaceae sp. PMI808]|nr:hypothetical protein GQ44DRAFT_425881 [Phaeosphaeriaceae sp. PMI808]